MTQPYQAYPAHPYPATGPGTVVVTSPRYPSSTAHVVIAWILTVVTALYLLPWAIAATRSHKDVGMIALVNVLLGWSLVGWIVSLVWACSNPGHQLVVVPPPYAGSVTTGYPEPYGPYVAPAAPPAQLTSQPYAQPYPQPSADQWQPAPWDRPSGSRG